MEGSANGYILGYSNEFGSWEFRATWPAPYFVFVDGMCDASDGEPLGLIHCDDLEHARALVRSGGRLLDASFVAVERSVAHA